MKQKVHDQTAFSLFSEKVLLSDHDGNMRTIHNMVKELLTWMWKSLVAYRNIFIMLHQVTESGSDSGQCQEQSAARGQWDEHGLSLKHSLVERNRENTVLHKFSTYI